MGIKKDIQQPAPTPVSHSHVESISGGCSSCARMCEEAKSKVKSLEKKVYVMTIVCTSAITLLGERGVQSLMSAINGMNSAITAASDIGKADAPKNQEQKDNNSNKQSNSALFGQPYQGHWQKPFKIDNKEQTRGYQISDELARFPKENKIGGDKPVEAPLVVTNEQNKLTKQIVQAALATDINLAPVTSLAAQTGFADPYAAFFTPSLLPFDVYSTTLALGTNYGFGEYYGIDTGGYYVPPSVPSPGAFTVVAFSQFFHNRKRI
jgi:hypothetical protein